MAEIDDEVLQDLYAWIDQIPLSRPKKNIARDFSDGVLMAEVVKHYFPGWWTCTTSTRATTPSRRRRTGCFLIGRHSRSSTSSFQTM
ncbi:hypothetical protein BOX15_Mlig017903g1 [Macrostomum lignano]|uniref:CH-like domain-containing protein n=1 Tax=Macrostomum lignano TaxID=282301 RepID=A0A267HAT5_9PLAT|nr:hypothetical protein BOX15_Mlig017903g1 [Macrostomum lignano]